MKTNSTQVRMGMAVVWSLLLMIGIGLGSSAQAQYDRNRRGRNWDNYGNYGGSFQLRQTALNAGYNEGMKDGTAARSRNRNTTSQIQTPTAKPPRTTAHGSAIEKSTAAIFVKHMKRDLGMGSIRAATTTSTTITTMAATGTGATDAGTATRTATGIPIIAAGATGIVMVPTAVHSICVRRL